MIMSRPASISSDQDTLISADDVKFMMFDCTSLKIKIDFINQNFFTQVYSVHLCLYVIARTRCHDDMKHFFYTVCRFFL